MLVRCQVPERPVFCFRSGAYVSHCCVFRFLPPRFLVNATRTFRIVCFLGIPGRTFRIARFCSFSFWSKRFSFVFFLANRGVLLALVCSLPSLQGGFAFFGFALVAPRGLLAVIPERTFRIAVFWCFSKMLFFGPGATKCRIGNVKKPTMQDARAGAPNKKGYARAGAQGKPDAPGQRKKSNAKRTRRDAN